MDGRSGSDLPPPQKLRERAYDRFTQRLLARDIQPGQFISQRELVDMTGLPLGAIRELIPRLESEGLIRTVPQRGMQVAHVDIDLVRNAFQFRLFLEREATALYTRNAGSDDIAALLSAHQDILRRAAQGPIDRTLITDAEQVDQSLHHAVIDHLDNAIISEAYRVNWIKVHLTRNYETRMLPHIVVAVMQDHLRVIEAMARRDVEGAVTAMTEHINNARNRAMGL